MPIAKRRSITVDQFVEDSINLFRASAAMNGLTFDFTTLINTFAEFGIRKARENTKDPLLEETLSKYASYDELREHGIVDEWVDFQEYKKYKEAKKAKTQSA
jgi:hypothetical protein